MIKAAQQRGISDFEAGRMENPYKRTDFRQSWWLGQIQRHAELAEKTTAAAATLPNAARWTQGRRDDGTTYLNGLRISGASGVGLVCQHNFTDIKDANFMGWNPAQHHYCPDGKWTDWVLLAKNILAVDAALSATRTPQESERS